MLEDAAASGSPLSLTDPGSHADVTGSSRGTATRELSRRRHLTLADPDCETHDGVQSMCPCFIGSGPRDSAKPGEDGQQRLFGVADVRRSTGITRKALLVYEGRGLVLPVQRTQAGYRLYDDEAMRRITLVCRAKALGLTLAEVANFIHMAEGCCAEDHGDLAMLLRRRIEQTERLIQALVRRRNELCQVLKALDEPCEDAGKIGSPASTALGLIRCSLRLV